MDLAKLAEKVKVSLLTTKIQVSRLKMERVLLESRRREEEERLESHFQASVARLEIARNSMRLRLKEEVGKVMEIMSNKEHKARSSCFLLKSELDNIQHLMREGGKEQAALDTTGSCLVDIDQPVFCFIIPRFQPSTVLSKVRCRDFGFIKLAEFMPKDFALKLSTPMASIKPGAKVVCQVATNKKFTNKIQSNMKFAIKRDSQTVSYVREECRISHDLKSFTMVFLVDLPGIYTVTVQLYDQNVLNSPHHLLIKNRDLMDSENSQLENPISEYEQSTESPDNAQSGGSKVKTVSSPARTSHLEMVKSSPTDFLKTALTVKKEDNVNTELNHLLVEAVPDKKETTADHLLSSFLHQRTNPELTMSYKTGQAQPASRSSGRKVGEPTTETVETSTKIEEEINGETELKEASKDNGEANGTEDNKETLLQTTDDGGIKEVPKEVQKRRMNYELKKILTPKGPSMVLNEILGQTTFKYEIQDPAPGPSGMRNTPALYTARTTYDGSNFSGLGLSKSVAKNVCAESVLQYITTKSCSQVVEEEGEERADANDRQMETDTPWVSLASLALFKLLRDWQYQGYQIPVDLIKGGPERLGGCAQPAGYQIKEGVLTREQTIKPSKKIPATPKENSTEKHPVTLLNELNGLLPYKEEGPPSTQPPAPGTVFTFTVSVNGEDYTGSGRNKKDAKKAAAMAALSANYSIVYPTEVKLE